jgi:hypothetical protein
LQVVCEYIYLKINVISSVGNKPACTVPTDPSMIRSLWPAQAAVINGTVCRVKKLLMPVLIG